MLSDEEKTFLEYWEKNREREKKNFKQLMIGLPLGLLFALPILVNFFSGWYTRADMVGRSQFNPLILIIAVLGIAIFLGLFSKKHQWDMREQRYQELKSREDQKMPDQDASS